MDPTRFSQISEFAWCIQPHDAMRVPGVIYADEVLLRDMDEKVYEQVVNVASLPGIIQASYAMPDAHWGYGFPIGGVAAFDPEQQGVVSAGGVGFDISCGVRTLHTGLNRSDIESIKQPLAGLLFARIPAGVGSTGSIRLTDRQLDDMLMGGARWAVEQGFGNYEDLERIEEFGQMAGAEPGEVSQRAKARQREEMGTLGSGNHYLEVQAVAKVYDQKVADQFGIHVGDVLVSIHCGSRGLGHQIGTEFLRRMVVEAAEHGISLPDRELACAPIDSPLGQAYLGAMRAAINCALANRQIITHLTRLAFRELLPQANLTLLYDVSHNTCKLEEHIIGGEKRRVFVHRKGATRAFGPYNRTLPSVFERVGQPVLIGGTMGTSSHILVGTTKGEELAFSSACHGAGRRMSRHKASRKWRGKQVVRDLEAQGILVRGHGMRGVAEEAPDAYKDVDAVVDVAHRAGLAHKVAKLEPMVCVKG